RLDEGVDQATQLTVEVHDGLGGGAQHRGPEQADRLNGHEALLNLDTADLPVYEVRSLARPAPAATTGRGRPPAPAPGRAPYGRCAPRPPRAAPRRARVRPSAAPATAPARCPRRRPAPAPGPGRAPRCGPAGRPGAAGRRRR